MDLDVETIGQVTYALRTAAATYRRSAEQIAQDGDRAEANKWIEVAKRLDDAANGIGRDVCGTR